LRRPLTTSQIIRVALGVGVALLLALLLWALLFVTDTAFSVWERLNRGPSWFLWLYGAGFLAVVAAGLYMLWRLLRPRAKVPADAAAERPPTQDELEARLAKAKDAGVDVAAVQRELAQLARRKEAGKIHVSFFGEISSGKSSLIRALLPGTELAIAASGGTTREVTEYRWQSPGGDELILMDMPGTNEVGAGLDDMARAEALRSHVVIYVCDGDLTRTQREDLQALLALEKPCIVALNKTDRYRQDELDLILGRLRERLGAAARVDLVAVQAGGQREAVRVLPDGREEPVVLEMEPRVDDLREALQRHLDEDPLVLEKLRDVGVFVLAARTLDQAQRSHRAERAREITTNHARKAMVGAMAAVAPGSDLVIQGYLGVAMVKALSNLYEVPVRRMDTDLLLELVQKRVARSTTIMLAVLGNALKAFPGLGTVAGGLVHAAAYGMIFESLGKAVAESMDSRGALRPAQAAKVFEDHLSEDLQTSARRFARLALDLKKDRGPGR
jgi:GTP-binding protein EngB required for normal cell division